MMLPDPFNPTPLPASTEDFNCPAWRRADEKARVHNLARRLALLPHKEARADALAELAEKHRFKPDFVARFKRIVKWYWRAQRARQKQQKG